eukprot:TRINITY_DN10341_c0_g1_i1.p1 TRINITY_DN10341_c0_g1~~TRINITY_DN10341_c0_g1_i1.p1  ORF type:complete len:678 (-),score=148.25 TRINITY_DN10341_c0_g1_i1:295-2328(-)
MKGDWRPSAAAFTAPTPHRSGPRRSIVPVSPDKANRDPFLGKLIRKRFGDQLFYGTVVNVDRDADTGDLAYHITYEDGDEEHLTMQEVQMLVSQPRMARYSTASTQSACIAPPAQSLPPLRMSTASVAGAAAAGAASERLASARLSHAAVPSAPQPVPVASTSSTARAEQAVQKPRLSGAVPPPAVGSTAAAGAPTMTRRASGLSGPPVHLEEHLRALLHGVSRQMRELFEELARDMRFAKAAACMGVLVMLYIAFSYITGPASGTEAAAASAAMAASKAQELRQPSTWTTPLQSLSDSPVPLTSLKSLEGLEPLADPPAMATRPLASPAEGAKVHGREAEASHRGTEQLWMHLDESPFEQRPASPTQEWHSEEALEVISLILSDIGRVVLDMFQVPEFWTDLVLSLPSAPLGAVFLGIVLVAGSLWSLRGEQHPAMREVQGGRQGRIGVASASPLGSAASVSPSALSSSSFAAPPTPLQKLLPSPARSLAQYQQAPPPPPPPVSLPGSMQPPVAPLSCVSYSMAPTHFVGGQSIISTPAPPCTSAYKEATFGGLSAAAVPPVVPGTPQRRLAATAQRAPPMVGMCYIAKIGKKSAVVRLDSLSDGVAYVSELQPYVSQRSGRFGLSDASGGRSVRMPIADIPTHTGFQLVEGRAPAHIEKLFKCKGRMPSGVPTTA